MKKIFTLLFFAGLTSAAMAQGRQSQHRGDGTNYNDQSSAYSNNGGGYHAPQQGGSQYSGNQYGNNQAGGYVQNNYGGNNYGYGQENRSGGYVENDRRGFGYRNENRGRGDEKDRFRPEWGRRAWERRGYEQGVYFYRSTPRGCF